MEHITRIFDITYHQLQRFPKEDCLTTKVNDIWQKTSTASFIEQAEAMAGALIEMGVNKGDRIATITTVNRTEWNITDLAILLAGAVNVPLYPTISEADYEYILNHAGASYCFLSDDALLEKINSVRANVPLLKEVFTFDKIQGCRHWHELVEEGMRSANKEEILRRKESTAKNDMATIIYTSGTTGKPKGVMLSHWNIVSNAIACIERLPVDEHGKALSFLPVCHVYERMLQYLYQLTGVSIYFAESMDTIGDNLKEVQPEVFTAVPRLLEKVYDKIMAKGNELTGVKKKLFFWAVGLGEQYDVVGKSAVYKFKLSIARKLIFSKWQAALGG
jgi:long-chain acyl-CoA synthetase